MMEEQIKQPYQADCVIVGGGLAGICTALELLDAGKKVLIIDRDKPKNFGGLARWAFGGMFFVNSPHQRRAGIKDNIELAINDWFSYAEFAENEVWGKKWAEQYIHLCTDHSYHWLRDKGLNFFPVINWAERGLFQPGNSVPRFHIAWGTGWGLMETLVQQINGHPKSGNLKVIFEHRVLDIIVENSVVKGVRGVKEVEGQPFAAMAEVVVVATGGINGSIEKVKANWPQQWGAPPQTILNGAHKYAIGDLHEATKRIDGNIVNLDKQWNYAAGIRHYAPRKKDHGLSLVPCKSALWLNYQGKRIGPVPLVTAYDTRYLIERICQEEQKYSWQVLNMSIAKKEFAISGAEHNPLIRDKKFVSFILQTLFSGNRKLVQQMIDNCEDVVIGNSLEELKDKMNAVTGENHVTLDHLRAAIEPYDAQIDKGKAFHNDEQLRRIAHARQYRGDRARTCKFQKINDPNAYPLIAIREFIISRKSLGGIQTDLSCRVLTTPDNNGAQQALEGLYAVGEAAGFGGGGMHGIRSLEGTFLGGCVITGRVAGRAILGKTLS